MQLSSYRKMIVCVCLKCIYGVCFGDGRISFWLSHTLICKTVGVIDRHTQRAISFADKMPHGDYKLDLISDGEAPGVLNCVLGLFITGLELRNKIC